jgi:hypothetical protein
MKKKRNKRGYSKERDVIVSIPQEDLLEQRTRSTTFPGKNTDFYCEDTVVFNNAVSLNY